MTTLIKLKNTANKTASCFYLVDKKSDLKKTGLNKDELAYVKKKHTAKDYFITLNKFDKLLFIQYTDEWVEEHEHQQLELLRVAGSKICGAINAHKYNQVNLVNLSSLHDESLLTVAEGCALSNYQFIRYKSSKEKNTLTEVSVVASKIAVAQITKLNVLCEAVCKARDLVNEPQNTLNAVTFANEMKQMGKASGLKVEVLNKKQIQSLKMGGLLAVNQGSKTPPTFTVMEWKPRGAFNKKPLVLVGKGVVYDTGGLSLKPTANSMDYMKCDMAGGALVAATMYAIAKAKLPVYVIGLVPATDNRPGEDAYTPGDVITMYDGQTVEVLNCDAEGRLLLADALAYAKKYNPELVMDFATLTGAAAAAIGGYGIVCMGTADEATKLNLKLSGNQTYERLVEFPLWDEYGKLLKSDIADMKNIGGPIAGAITAGKFLEKFTKYPWMHFDIAGPAWNNSADAYRPKNGTGVGVRLMFDFITNLIENN
ncbi:MAG: leucyl aminopeptidase family protein [Bacteroidota bacterium]